ncbi:hypothetical protein H0H93_011235 [Arthromyces matolae]|nr:hypothetical protein H0H93_011235 [Arthromyces matolae]
MKVSEVFAGLEAPQVAPSSGLVDGLSLTLLQAAMNYFVKNNVSTDVQESAIKGAYKSLLDAFDMDLFDYDELDPDDINEAEKETTSAPIASNSTSDSLPAPAAVRAITTSSGPPPSATSVVPTPASALQSGKHMGNYKQLLNGDLDSVKTSNIIPRPPTPPRKRSREEEDDDDGVQMPPRKTRFAPPHSGQPSGSSSSTARRGERPRSRRPLADPTAFTTFWTIDENGRQPGQRPFNHFVPPPRSGPQGLRREGAFYHRSHYEIAWVPEFGDFNSPPMTYEETLPPWDPLFRRNNEVPSSTTTRIEAVVEPSSTTTVSAPISESPAPDPAVPVPSNPRSQTATPAPVPLAGSRSTRSSARIAARLTASAPVTPSRKRAVEDTEEPETSSAPKKRKLRRIPASC